MFGYLVTAPNHRCVLPSNLKHVRSLVGSYLSDVGQGRGVFPGGFEELCRPFAARSHKAATGLLAAAVLAPRR